MLAGIDVSRYQGNIDWSMVRKSSDVCFSAIRATVGNYYTDFNFKSNWQAASDNGFSLSPYHVVRPRSSASSQINRLLETLEGLPAPSLPIVLDVEVTDGQSLENVKKCVFDCVSLLEAEHRRIIIYTGAWFWNTLPHEKNASYDSMADLWVAAYTSEEYMLKTAWPKGWRYGNWNFWQHTNKGRIPGISGDVDLNFFNGDTLEGYSLAKPPVVETRTITITGKGLSVVVN